LNSRYTVLLVEDDTDIASVMVSLLESQGYRVRVAGDVATAQREIASARPDLILLDLGLPDGDGLAVLQAARRVSALPVIVVSAREEEFERVKALDAGADDYVLKPFTVPEFLARIRAALRRLAHDGRQSAILALETLTVDLERRLAMRDEKAVHLTPIEFRLLEALARSRGRPVTTAALIREVWGEARSDDTQGLRTYVRLLRQKIEADPTRPRLLCTEPGVGYRLAGD